MGQSAYRSVVARSAGAIVLLVLLATACTGGEGLAVEDSTTTTEPETTTEATTTTDPTTTTTRPTTTTAPPTPEEQYVNAIDEAGLRETTSTPGVGESTDTDEELVTYGRDYCDRALHGHNMDGEYGPLILPSSGHQMLERDLASSPETARTIELAIKHLCPEAQPILDDVRAGNIVPAPAVAVFGAGSHTVNVEIQPGTYQTTDPSPGCYWERLDGAGEIIDNNFVSNAPQVQATIAGSDFAFNSNDCGTWHKIG